jgi:hypothetical protein
MGLGRTQGDVKRLPFGYYCPSKRLSPLCHLDRKRSAVERSAVFPSFLEMFFGRGSHGPSAHPRGCKTAPVRQLLSLEAPPSPLSSRPKRSAVERSAVQRILPGKCFSAEEVTGLGRTQGDEKRLPFGYYCPSKRLSPLCHLDRSAAQWRDLRFSGSFLGNVFRQSAAQWRDLRFFPVLTAMARNCLDVSTVRTRFTRR